jgi:four helix bundle protein
LKSHRDLDVWKRSIDLVTKIYKATDGFPNSEIYGLASQIRRCSVSIPSNIAEGASRKSINEFKHFLYIALGSSSELETQLIIANNLDFINELTCNKLSEELANIGRMLQGLIRSLDKAEEVQIPYHLSDPTSH